MNFNLRILLIMKYRLKETEHEAKQWHESFFLNKILIALSVRIALVALTNFLPCFLMKAKNDIKERRKEKITCINISMNFFEKWKSLWPQIMIFINKKHIKTHLKMSFQAIVSINQRLLIVGVRLVTLAE